MLGLTLISPGLFRGWFNAEFMVLTAVYALRRSRLVLACMAFNLLIDLVEPIAHIYYFTLTDALRSFQFLAALPRARLLAYCACLILYLGAAVLSVRAAFPRKPARVLWPVAGALIALVVAQLALDVTRGRYVAMGGDMRDGGRSIARMPALVLLVRCHAVHQWDTQGSATSIRSATSELLRASGPRLLELRPNVVIVLAESWGEMQDAASRKAFMDFYQRRGILQRYTVESGSVPFAGMTLAGETRELCSTTLGTGVMSATAAQLRGCLPTLFKEHGYHTMAVHGFSPHMFHRAQWYPDVHCPGRCLPLNCKMTG